MSRPRSTFTSRLRGETGLVLAAVLLGVAARLVVTVALYRHGATYKDENQYWDLAGRIRAGLGLTNPFGNMSGMVVKGEPTAMWGLVFPYFLAAWQAVLGARLLLVRLVVGQLSWIGLCAAMLGYSRRWFSTRQQAALVALMAVHPSFVYLDSFLMTESLFIPATAAVLWMGQAWRQRPTARRSVAWGAVYGVVHLIRMNLLGFQIWQAAWGAWGARTRWRRVGLIGLSLAATALVLAPWAWRNDRVYGQSVLQTKTGFNLVLMNRPGAAIPAIPAGLNEAQRNAAYQKLAFAMIRQHPAAFLRNCGRRLAEAWALVPKTIALPRPLRAAVSGYDLLLYGFMLAGIVSVWRQQRPFGDAVLLVAYVTLLMALTNAAFRHRSYADPFILLLAVEGASWAWSSWRPRRLEEPGTLAAHG